MRNFVKIEIKEGIHAQNTQFHKEGNRLYYRKRQLYETGGRIIPLAE